jgi:hypothetical protein
MYSLALIIFVVSEKKAFEHFPIRYYVNLCPAVVAILDFRSGKKTQKFVEDLPMIIPGQLNCLGMIIGRSSTKFLFSMLIGNPRWPPPQDID